MPSFIVWEKLWTAVGDSRSALAFHWQPVPVGLSPLCIDGGRRTVKIQRGSFYMSLDLIILLDI